jgi:hypothetical protein
MQVVNDGLLPVRAAEEVGRYAFVMLAIHHGYYRNEVSVLIMEDGLIRKKPRVLPHQALKSTTRKKHNEDRHHRHQDSSGAHYAGRQRPATA